MKLSLFAVLAVILALAMGQAAQAIFHEPEGLSADDTVGLATDFSPSQDMVLAASYGSDVSQPHSASQFRCLLNENLVYTIVRVWRSLGNPDPNGPTTIKNAWAGGQRYVDGYIFPCPKCAASGAEQMRGTFNHLRGVRYGMLWLDVEGPQYWTTQAANRKFLESMMAEGQRLGVKMGVYTSKSQWGPIMGLDYTKASHLPLWYAHYDGRPTFDDFVPFGGWRKPAIKQFSDQGKKCSSSYDINYYPV